VGELGDTGKMTHTCETMPDTSDVQCGKPATLEVDYLAPPPPAADGKVQSGVREIR
jgi:hypothetical protein